MDVLFNNAGIGESGWFEDVPYEAAMRVVQVNFVGVLTGIYTALPLLKATKNSLCFTTSSSSATYGMPRLAVYSATKHAVKGLTEALSIEFARHGIRVADTLPGLIDTAILRNTPNRSDGRTPDEAETMLANAPKKGPFRLMPPSAVARSRMGGLWQRQAALVRAARDRLDRPHQGLLARDDPQADQEVDRGRDGEGLIILPVLTGEVARSAGGGLPPLPRLTLGAPP